MALVLDQPCRFCNDRGQEGRYGKIYSSYEGVSEQSEAKGVCDKCAFLKEVVRCCIAKGLFVSGTVRSRIMWYQEKLRSAPMEGEAPKECDFLSRWSDAQFQSCGEDGKGYEMESLSIFEVFTLPGLAKPFLDFPIKTLPELTSSDYSLKMVQGWLETCDRSHKSCLPQRAGLNTALPKRVLDLSAPLVRLYETHGESARYACLSHCWGATRPACRTTSKKGSPENPSATLEENRKGIEWNALPATFRDAIHFTRRLGIRYLWIDSICIIQDDSTDWSEQSGKMANIYENSYITLCATASSSDDGGCYSHTPPHWEPQRIRARTRDNTEYEVYVRHQLKERHLPSWESAHVGSVSNNSIDL